MDPVEIINLLLSFITASAFVFLAIQVKINQKQLFLSTITKCINDFRNLDINRETTDMKIIHTYIDLVNEELFYFQHNYIPKNVSKEWIDGMIDFMPITNKKLQVLNSEFSNKFIADNRDKLIRNFPRIQNAFEVRESYDFNSIYSDNEAERKNRVAERKKLINEIYSNIKHFNWFN